MAGNETDLSAGPKRADLAHLAWCVDDGVAVILDIQRGVYHAMDRATTERFAAYAEGADDPEFRDALAAAGLAGDAPADGAHPRPLQLPVPSIMAAKTILAARRHLARRGFRAALDWALAHGPRRRLTDAAGSFRRADALLPHVLGDRDCLPRALALFAFLRHAGQSPAFVLGIKRFPFTAHAWVEAAGAPVLENASAPERVASFREILRVL